MLTSVEAAKVLKVHPTTMANWRMNELGPKYVRKGRRVYYRLRDLERYYAGEGLPKPRSRKS